MSSFHAPEGNVIRHVYRDYRLTIHGQVYEFDELVIEYPNRGLQFEQRTIEGGVEVTVTAPLPRIVSYRLKRAATDSTSESEGE